MKLFYKPDAWRHLAGFVERIPARPTTRPAMAAEDFA